MGSIRGSAVARVDRWDGIIEKVAFEIGECRGGSHTGVGAVILLCATVRHHDDHWNGLFVGKEIIHQSIHMGKSLPFGFVAAYPVENVKHGVFHFLGVSGRSVNLYLASGSDSLGIVFNDFQFAVRNPFPH